MLFLTSSSLDEDSFPLCFAKQLFGLFRPAQSCPSATALSGGLIVHSRGGRKAPGWMCPEQVGIVKLHARLTATHAFNGLAASVWNRASKARIGIPLAGQEAVGVVVLRHEEASIEVIGHHRSDPLSPKCLSPVLWRRANCQPDSQHYLHHGR